MWELAAALAVLVPSFVILHDKELELWVTPSPLVVQTGGGDEFGSRAIEEHLRQEMANIVLIADATHDTVPLGLVEYSPIESLAELAHVENQIYTVRAYFGHRIYELNIGLTQNVEKLEWDATLFRLQDGPLTTQSWQYAPEDYGKAIRAIAIWAMRNFDPLTLLQYRYVVGKETGDLGPAWAEVAHTRTFYDGTYDGLIENLVGMMYLLDGNAAAAEHSFRFARRADPNLYEAKLNFAVALAAGGQRAAAMQVLDSANQANEPLLGGSNTIGAAALALQGLIADGEGNADLAIAKVSAAVEADPNLAEANEIAAAVFQEHGYIVQARHHAKRAISLRTHQPPRLGRAFLEVAKLQALLSPARQSVQSAIAPVSQHHAAAEADRHTF